MNRKSLHLLACGAIAAGLTLVFYESRALQAGEGGDAWFWLLVGVLALVFGVVDIVMGSSKPR